MDSSHRARLIWAYLRPEINEINLQCMTSTEMPVKVHDLKTMHYQSKNNKEGHNQQESNDHIDDKDNMQLDNTEESGMDGVLNRLINALSEMAGLRIPVSLNDPSITDHDNTIPAKNGIDNVPVCKHDTKVYEYFY
eukprot:scaffold203827_cov53-Attheya_sp.AAC.1